MFQRKLSATALMLLICGAYPIQASSSAQQFIQIHQQQKPQTGQTGVNQSATNESAAVQTQTIPLSAGGAVSVDNLSGQVKVNSFDPSQPQRLLVRLKDQPLRPYLKQQREQLAVAGKLSRSAQQQLAKSSQSQLQRVQKSQNQLLGELRKQKLMQKVHGQFTQLTNTLSITATADSIEQIRGLPQVAAVYPDERVEAFLAESVGVTKAPQLWAMRDAQSRAITGQGVTVAILDTGIDYTHPDLGGCIGAGCKVAGGYNFIEGEDATNPIDKHGHGTHVAGIVAAKGTLTGVAPDATLYAYKVLSDQGWGMDSSIIAAMEKAIDPDGDPLTDDQIDVINMSLGGGGAPDSPLSEAANNAMAAGVMVVVAAGNSGSSYSTIGSPGNADQVLTVGASDNNGDIAYFSSRGPIAGQSYIKPELVAPGVEINSAKPGGSYVRLSGTSMATPHVAGGAALLRQLYPKMSSADLKTLLINTSRDLGEDVFTQGAGMMDLEQAASATLLVSPALLSAGSVDLELASWTATVPLKLKNIGNTSLAIETIAPTQLPQGAAASASAAQTLEVGQEAAANVQLVVDTKTLPFAESATLHHEVAAAVRYNGKDIRLPLTFSKSAKLNIEFDGVPWILHVINADDTYSNTYYFNSCTEKPANFSIDLKPGTYHLATIFYGENCAIDSLVFKENIALQEKAVARLAPADAVYEWGVGTVTDKTGNPLSLAGLSVHTNVLQWQMGSYGSAIFLGSGTQTIIKTSAASERLKMAVSSFFSLKETAPGVAGEYYLVGDSIEEGINQSHKLDLDLRTAGEVDFTFADYDVLAQSVTFTLGLSQLRSIFDFAAFGTYLTKSDVYTQPVSAKVHASLSLLEKGEWYPDMGVNRLTDDPFAWNTQLMRTGPIGFVNAQSFTKLRGAFSTPDETNYRSTSPALQVTDSAYLMAPAFYFSEWNKELRVQSMSEPYWAGGSFTIQRDAQQNSFFDLMPYRLLCDGQQRSSLDVSGGSFNVPLGSDACSDMVFELDQPVRFLGVETTSNLRLELDTTKVPGLDGYLLKEFPEQLQFFNDGVPSRVLNGSNLEVQLGMRSMTEEVATESPVMEYRLENTVDWVPLTLTRQANRYVAKLPVLDGAHKVSLRISLGDSAKGVKLVQTLDKIIALGQDAKGIVVAPPSFAALPRLTVEATAPFTAYSLPAVFASDINDGQIAATTTDLGPYAIGSRNIQWKATNSIGKTATAMQILDVRDTTAPVITVPANITVEATGTLTDIQLPEVKAYDLVDGEMTAWTADWKPFPVGTSSVIWNARDANYNLSYVIQTITVKAAASSQASSSASSKSPISNGGGNSGGGGGGGGAMSFWILLLSGVFFIGRYGVRSVSIRR